MNSVKMTYRFHMEPDGALSCPSALLPQQCTQRPPLLLQAENQGHSGVPTWWWWWWQWWRSCSGVFRSDEFRTGRPLSLETLKALGSCLHSTKSAPRKKPCMRFLRQGRPKDQSTAAKHSVGEPATGSRDGATTRRDPRQMPPMEAARSTPCLCLLAVPRLLAQF